MKTLFYPTLALNGMTKNRKTYLPYSLTCIGMVMMYYILSFLSKNESVGKIQGGRDLQMILSLGTGVIAVFAVIFLFYTYSFLIRKRKKEFGLYNILGMGKRNIACILSCESIFLAVLTIVIGLACGILFSKLTELIATKMLHGVVNLTFTIEWRAIRNTVILFLFAYLLIFLNALRQIHVNNPISLLHSDTVGEKPPKARWLLTLLGLLILGTAYTMSLRIQDPMTAINLFFVAVIMVIVATYLLFLVGSVTFCRLLQEKKSYYYQTSHFVSVSSMVYRMKRNGTSLASICVLSTMVLVMISSTLCLYIGKEDNVRTRYPRDIILRSVLTPESDVAVLDDIVAETLTPLQFSPQDLLTYEYLPLLAYDDHGTLVFSGEKLTDSALMDVQNMRELYFFTIDTYNRLMGTSEQLDADTIMTYVPKNGTKQTSIQLEHFPVMPVAKQTDQFPHIGLDNDSLYSSIFIFLPDQQMLEALSDMVRENTSRSNSVLSYFYGFNLACDDEMMKQVTKTFHQAFVDAYREGVPCPSTSPYCIAEERSSFYAMYSGLFLLGILLSIVFITAAVLIMYYKQISEGYEDCARFEIMQKVGMTKREIRKSINSQVLTVFGLPLVTAGVHMAFALPIVVKLLRLFGLLDAKLFVFVTIGCYLVFSIFYALVYFVTSRSYFTIVSEKND